MRIVVSGATGFVGTALCQTLLANAHTVTAISRDPERAKSDLPADVTAVSWADAATALARADGIVNLSGEPVAQRWTDAVKEKIVRSRVEAVERLAAALKTAKRRPSVILNASAVGFYGARGDEELYEESPPGSDFLARTTIRWEEAARTLAPLAERLVIARIGIVLGPEGGALGKMLPPFKLGVGGPIGSGQQWMSWIHRQDLCDLLVFALETPTASGIVNATAPHPQTMKTFASTLAGVLHRPCLVGPPAAALKLVLGEMSTIVLDGQRVLPLRALGWGFKFKFPDLEPALKDLLNS